MFDKFMTGKRSGNRKPTHQEILEAARVGEVWDEYRKKHKVTQAEMADKMGYAGQGSFAAYLRPENTPVNLDFILKFAAITGCRPAYIRPSLEDNPALRSAFEDDLLGKFHDLDKEKRELVLALIDNLAAAQK